MQKELTMKAEIAKPESLTTTEVLYIFKCRFFKVLKETCTDPVIYI